MTDTFEIHFKSPCVRHIVSMPNLSRCELCTSFIWREFNWFFIVSHSTSVVSIIRIYIYTFFLCITVFGLLQCFNLNSRHQSSKLISKIFSQYVTITDPFNTWLTTTTRCWIISQIITWIDEIVVVTIQCCSLSISLSLSLCLYVFSICLSVFDPFNRNNENSKTYFIFDGIFVLWNNKHVSNIVLVIDGCVENPMIFIVHLQQNSEHLFSLAPDAMLSEMAFIRCIYVIFTWVDLKCSHDLPKIK